MSMQDGVVPDDFKQGTKELLSYLKSVFFEGIGKGCSKLSPLP